MAKLSRLKESSWFHLSFTMPYMVLDVTVDPLFFIRVLLVAPSSSNRTGARNSLANPQQVQEVAIQCQG